MKINKFNLKAYKTAAGTGLYGERYDGSSPVTGPDMSKLRPGLLETLQDRYPTIKWTAELAGAVKSWIDSKFMGKLPPIPPQVAQDLARRPLD